MDRVQWLTSVLCIKMTCLPVIFDDISVAPSSATLPKHAEELSLGESKSRGGYEPQSQKRLQSSHEAVSLRVLLNDPWHLHMAYELWQGFSKRPEGVRQPNPLNFPTILIPNSLGLLCQFVAPPLHS